MPVFHAYRRVSDEKQEHGGFSLEAQDSLLKKLYADKYAASHRYLEYCDPSVTSIIPWFERKAGQLIFSQLSPGDVVAVATFDRAFRSLKDLCDSLDKLMERDITMDCLDLPVDISTIEGQLVLKLMGSVKEYERKVIGKRVKAINEWKRANGLAVCCRHSPLGYKRNKNGKEIKWVPWQEERQFGQRLVLMHEADGLSFREVYYKIQAEKNRGVLTFQKKGLSYAYLERLYYAARSGFPLPDGEKLPATAAEYLQWYKDHEP